MADKPLLRDGP